MSARYIRESVIRGHHVSKAQFTSYRESTTVCKCMKEGIYIGRDLRVKVKYVLQNSTRHFGAHYAKLCLVESSWLFTYV